MSKKFIVRVMETTFHDIVVEAESKDEAWEKVVENGFDAGYEKKFYTDGLKLREVVEASDNN